MYLRERSVLNPGDAPSHRTNKTARTKVAKSNFASILFRQSYNWSTAVHNTFQATMLNEDNYATASSAVVPESPLENAARKGNWTW